VLFEIQKQLSNQKNTMDGTFSHIHIRVGLILSNTLLLLDVNAARRLFCNWLSCKNKSCCNYV